ncbi:MAG: NUDIX domain-containing protein [Nanoarchaeota archaeon]|nr:NUDIX domain-containing protein [Nanoarchaeota archaeon]MBU0963142.1 NUDIX domain-containing protein [Nanoarchaeota archaeon]
MDKFVRVGVGVYILKDNKILFGKRKGSHGSGTWCPPGGHLEFNESIEECAIREVMEETGIKIKNIKLKSVTNDLHKNEDKHYITLHIIADYDSGEVKLKEPEKFEKWEWIEWNNLPKPLFLPIQNLLKQNFNPFE